MKRLWRSFYIIISFTIGCGGSGSDLSQQIRDDPVQRESFPAKLLPSKFIAATAFVSGIKTALMLSQLRTSKLRDCRLSIWYWIGKMSIKISMIAMFDLLENMIWEIKSRVFTVFFYLCHVQGHWQAWPVWLKPIELIMSKRVLNIAWILCIKLPGIIS